jgi:hypothetical protein
VESGIFFRCDDLEGEVLASLMAQGDLRAGFGRLQPAV